MSLRRDVGHVAFVVLWHVRNFVDTHRHGGRGCLEGFKALDIPLHFVSLEIGNGRDTVRTAHHQLAGSVVDDLTGDGVELKLRFQSPNHPRAQR